MILDYVVAAASLVLVAGLASVHALPAWLLVLIAVVMSLTSIFSSVGLRTLFPLIVPRHLWERANALDSNGYVVATIFGPPIAASLVAFGGGPAALVAIGIVYALTALSMVGVHDPLDRGDRDRDAAERRAGRASSTCGGTRTLRGLGISVSVLNLAGGMTTIVVPLLVLRQLGANEALVGILFAISGVSGMVSALVFGRIDTRGREWVMLVVPPLGTRRRSRSSCPSRWRRRRDARRHRRRRSGSASSPSPSCSVAWSTARSTSPCSRFASDAPTRPGSGGRSRSRWASTSSATRSARPSRAFIAASSLGGAVVLGIGACLASGVLAAVLIPARDPATETAGLTPAGRLPGAHVQPIWH